LSLEGFKLTDSNAAKKSKFDQPNIFEFTDVVEFLKSHLDYLKTIDKQNSLRKIARDAQFSPGYLPLVLARKRTLSVKMAEKLLEVFQLDRSESAYFLLLVTMGKSKSQLERFEAYKKIRRYQQYQQINSFEAESVNFLSHWHIVAIKELLAHNQMKADPKAIQKELDYHVSVVNIERALEFLEDKGFITIEKDLSVIILKKKFFFRDGIFQIALAEHHKQMLEKAMQSIDKNHKDERFLSGYSLQLNSKTYSQAVDILEKALGEIADLENDIEKNQKTRVYHLELAAFPLSGGSK
jgi:uncharacterized protein (TIGR02147 family)